MKILHDNDLLRGEYEDGRPIPLTKKEVRILSCALLEIGPDDLILDIGSGSGGTALQMALEAGYGKVICVEKSRKACHLIKENARRNGLDNVAVLRGRAPQVLENIDTLRFDRIFIGGSSGELEAILSFCMSHLKRGGRLCLNFITPENLVRGINYFRSLDISFDVTQLQVSKGREVGSVTLMKAENPVYIVLVKK